MLAIPIDQANRPLQPNDQTIKIVSDFRYLRYTSLSNRKPADHTAERLSPERRFCGSETLVGDGKGGALLNSDWIGQNIK